MAESGPIISRSGVRRHIWNIIFIMYVPGRIRIETPVIRENQEKADQFQKFVKGVDGIKEVQTHTVTGSALLFFDERTINCEQVIGILEKNGYFCLSKAETSDQYIEKVTEKVLKAAEDVVTTVLG
ncbi:MAG TPA: hypothetical protein VEI46_07330 [Thermodesulfovibrionales bacterium]|nr:hypothetical protein [Thermodesulfovibrionales bacterium]